MVETPNDCTVLVTTGLKRTCKLLSAIGIGRPIVNPNWLIMSKSAGNFLGKELKLPFIRMILTIHSYVSENIYYICHM